MATKEFASIAAHRDELRSRETSPQVSATLVYILMPEIYDHAKLDLAGRGDDLDGRDGPERRSLGRCGDLALDQKASSTSEWLYKIGRPLYVQR